MTTLRGGKKLERALAQMTAQLSKQGTLRVGFLEGATYPDGTPVAMVAATQDAGSTKMGIPPRPFFRNMIAKCSPGWPKALAAVLRENDYDATVALGLMGQLIEGQLRQEIIETNSPALKAATIKRKGFDKPLIDSSQMINSVASEIKG